MGATAPHEQLLVRAAMPLHLPTIILAAVPYFFLLMAVEFLVAVYRERKVYRLNDTVSSVSMGICSRLTGIWAASARVFPYMYIRTHYGFFLGNEDVEYGWGVWLATLILLDLCYYWFHRLAHECNTLWAGHIVHHSSQEYNLSTALRQGSWQGATSWIFYLPLALFAPLDVFLFHDQWNALYQFWIHTRLIDRLPSVVEYWFNTPSHHRVHHGRNAQYIDKNYGGTLIIWDRLFGTFEPEGETVVYGVTHDLGTWDTLYLQTHHWAEMWQTVSATPSWIDKVRVFIDLGPGYNYCTLYPDLVANPPPPITPAREVKYDSRPWNGVMTVYVTLHTVAFLAASLIMLLAPAGTYDIVNGSLLILMGMWTVAAIFDRKPYATIMELARLILIAASSLFHAAIYPLPSLALLASGAAVIVYNRPNPWQGKTKRGKAKRA